MHAPGGGEDGDADELPELVAYLAGRCEHMARLAEATTDPVTMAGYLIAAHAAVAPLVERLRALTAEAERVNTLN